MIKGLYDSFAKRWYRPGGTIWFYSDPHFSDEEMVHLRKNYIGDEEQVKAINKKVGKNDTIIFLGDIGNVEWIKKIRGYKVLIMGNHDAGASNYTDYFDEVYEGILMISEKLVLSHEPICFPYATNVHGHDHAGWSQWYLGVNVCAEHIDYTPVNIKDILNSGLLKKTQNIHREIIDEATDRKKKRGGRPL